MLQPNSSNKIFHARTRSKAKMYEYSVPLEQHINVGDIPLSDMFDLTIGMLGDLAASGSMNLEEEKYRLLFSAQYFNSILEAKIISHSQTFIHLLSASAYYLAGYPGSSQVLLKNINREQIGALTQMEQVLFVILKRDFLSINRLRNSFDEDTGRLLDAWNNFLIEGGMLDELDKLSEILRLKIYASGSDKDLLLIDIIRTLILKRVNVSVKTVLSRYSDIDMALWGPYFLKPNHIDEFWPSQVKLAEYGVFGGVSAVIQMPTSAGKTKATEFIVRSSFLSNRSVRAVIVAPFRSLCQEIYNDFNKNFAEDADVDVGLVSDVLQEDFDFSMDTQKSILILTPEKLDFMLRHDASFSESIGLIVYDEGHLFDDDTRGAKYELLLSSLRQQLPVTAQIVLISAVISNAQEVKEWLIKKNGVLVDGKDLSPTNRSIAFVDWTQRSRAIQFVEEHDINQGLFFVPAVLKSYEIDRRTGERAKFFPKPKPRGAGYESSQIAGFLGARLSSSGLSAIFVGQKRSAERIAKDLIDAYNRNLPIEKPIAFSEDQIQCGKIISYIGKLLGLDSINTEAAKLGILMHHTCIPHGLRLVTEHALQNSYFKTVICTSTLAQGVNLPIRYLIISTSHQAGEKIKIRDFHNLMGRAGRSGKYTEGTVIFSNPDIYQAQGARGRSWTDTARLLNSTNAEPSKSRMHLLLLDKPDDQEEQLKWEANIISIKKEVTSYLLNALSGVEDAREMERVVIKLVQNTFGYSQLETDEKKTILTGIFLEIGLDIFNRVPNSGQRLLYGRSILSLEQSQEFVASIQANINQIIYSLESGNFMNSLEVFWGYLYRYSNNKVLKSFSQENSLILCRKWIEGASFGSILELAQVLPRTVSGRAASLNMINIVELCESGFSYDISTLLGSLYELVTIVLPEEYLELIKPDCYITQKRLKYGIQSELESVVYELGFSDRDLCSEIASLLEGSLVSSRAQVIQSIKDMSAIRGKIEVEYPRYFLDQLNNL